MYFIISRHSVLLSDPSAHKALSYLRDLALALLMCGMPFSHLMPQLTLSHHVFLAQIVSPGRILCGDHKGDLSYHSLPHLVIYFLYSPNPNLKMSYLHVCLFDYYVSHY